MPTLRILQITPYYAGAWAYGGVPRAASALSNALARRGHRVTVATTDVCDERTRLSATASDARYPGVAVHVFPNRSNRLAYHHQVFTPRGLRAYLEEDIRRFDLVHVHAHRHALELHAAAVCGSRGVPFVLTPNGTAPRIERRRVAKAIFDLAIGHRVLRRASVVTAVSEAERRQLVRLGVEPGRIRLLPNSLDLREFDGFPLPSPAKEHSRGRVVLFLGKLTPRKGVDVLVRALAELDPDTRLRIAGNDMGAGRSARALARRLGVTSRIDWLGLLRGQERLRALAAADLVVYPSRDEVFGLVALESLLCGTPVIVGNDNGCAEIIRRVGGGSEVPPGDAGRLAAEIRSHLDALDSWRARAASAAGLIRRTFDSTVVAATAEGIYREALCGPLEASA